MPLLAISGTVDGELRQQLTAAGLRHNVWALTTPFTPRELLHTVARVLAAYRKVEQ